MASRTKQKEEARARRLAEEQARAERQRRQRLLRTVAGVAVGAIVVIAVAIAVSTSGGGGGSSVNNKTLSQDAAQVQQLLAGIPQSGARLGSPTAPVTMTYYGDLECPICQDFTLSGGFPQLVSNDVRAGKVKVVFRAFQTATPDQSTFNTQQGAALAAGRQNLFWNFAELFYRQQGQEGTHYVTESYLDGLARSTAGLNYNAWQDARKDSALLSQVQADVQSGNAAHVQGTPTLIFTGPKGSASPSAGVPSYSDLEQAIKQVS